METEFACYASPGKRKAALLCNAFAEGVRASGGSATVYLEPPRKLAPGAAVFYGVVQATQHLFDEARALRREWWYIDNAYFDAGRGRYFRVTRNAMQLGRVSEPKPERAAALGLVVKPWRESGKHVLVCPQSDDFMLLVGWRGGMAGWLRHILHELRSCERPVAVRHWSRDKLAAAQGLGYALKNAWALVTHASAAANEALLAGVPVFLTSHDCAALPVASGALASIGDPALPDDREQWVARLAGAQWTLDELRAGEPWRR